MFIIAFFLGARKLSFILFIYFLLFQIVIQLRLLYSLSSNNVICCSIIFSANALSFFSIASTIL